MSEFCTLCDVSLDLHNGPDTCSLAMRKAFVVSEFYGITTYLAVSVTDGAA